MTKQFIWIIGPQAVGKMSVGKQLAQKLGYLFSHNHDSIELALRFHPYGTEAFSHINGGVRQLIRENVLKYASKGFVFTYVMAFDHESEVQHLNRVNGPFLKEGWKIRYVELEATEKIRLQRNAHPERLDAKPSKREREESDLRLQEAAKKYILNSNEEYRFPLDKLGASTDAYIKIINDNLTVEQQIAKILMYFDLTST